MGAPAGPWSVTYHDGSANTYAFASADENAAFEYIPITPEQSSTGMYSGGDPRAGRLDHARCAELWRQILALESNDSLHTTNRAKGTGAFTITDGDATRSFIIERGPALLAFDVFVTTL